jgi:hypothetical protein
MADDERPKVGPLLTSVLSGNRLAGDSSVAFRVGVITSDKGYIIELFAEVNRLVSFSLEFLPPVLGLT